LVKKLLVGGPRWGVPLVVGHERQRHFQASLLFDQGDLP
jgi:hypothetical protein